MRWNTMRNEIGLSVDQKTWPIRQSARRPGDLSQILLKVLLQAFFDIKVKDRLEDASHHILTQLRILRILSKRVKGIVTPYVCSGAWHSHHENVLLALLASPDKENRKFGIDQILKLRNGKEIGDLSVRYRKTPKLNLKATTLQDLVSWTSGDIHEPVFTCSLSNEELTNILEKPYVTPDVKIKTPFSKLFLELKFT